MESWVTGGNPGGYHWGTAQARISRCQPLRDWCARLRDTGCERTQPHDDDRHGAEWGRRDAMNGAATCGVRSQVGVGGMPVSVAHPAPPMCRLLTD